MFSSLLKVKYFRFLWTHFSQSLIRTISNYFRKGRSKSPAIVSFFFFMHDSKHVNHNYYSYTTLRTKASSFQFTFYRSRLWMIIILDQQLKVHTFLAIVHEVVFIVGLCYFFSIRMCIFHDCFITLFFLISLFDWVFLLLRILKKYTDKRIT